MGESEGTAERRRTMRLVRAITRAVTGDETDIRFRIYRIVSLVGTFLVFSTTFFFLFSGNAEALATCSAMLVVAVATTVYALRTGNYQNANTVISLALFVGGLSVMFFKQGGVHGASLGFFVMAMGYTAFSIEGRRAIAMVALEAVVYSADIYLASIHPEWVEGMPQTVWEIIVPFVCCGSLLALTVGLQLSLYLRQQLKLNELNDLYYRRYQHDELTGLYNRYGLEAVYPGFARATDGLFSVLLFDIDHFKRVNDEYGHLVGDAVLRELASCVSEVVGAGDVVARWGGEEFVVLTNNPAPDRLAEEMRRRVEARPIEAEGHELRVTVSIGVATYVRDIPAIDRLISEADTAMYDAKEGGRNRVVVNGDHHTAVGAALG